MERTPFDRILRVAAVCLAASLLAACVTRGSYDTLSGERNELLVANELLIAEKAGLEDQVEVLQVEKDALALELAAWETEVSDLKGTYDALVSDLESELATGQVKIRQLRDGIRLDVADEILFASGSAKVDGAGLGVLQKVAAQVKSTTSPILVTGHTDNVRISSALSSRYPTNWELAGARAASVVRILQEEGVAGEQLQAVSAGPYQPVASNDTAEGRQKNRRIEIRLLPEAKPGSTGAPQVPASGY